MYLEILQPEFPLKFSSLLLKLWCPLLQGIWNKTEQADCISLALQLQLLTVFRKINVLRLVKQDLKLIPVLQNNKQQFGAGVAARTATGIQDFHLHHQIHPASCLTGESKNAWRKAFLLLPPYFFGAFGGSLSVWPLKEEQWELQSITVSSTAFSMLLFCLIFLLFMQICSTRHFLFSNLLQCECLLSWF